MRRDLRGLSKEGADWVAAHLVAAGALADEEPELAWRHARAARARGGRIGVVRETVGLVAYRAGEWAEAIGELRAARRMGGGPGHLAVMADSERALGHPERAIELSRSTEADDLDPEAATELQIVVAGARADLGQVDAALAQVERLGLDKAEAHPRLAYAYADLLLKAGRREEALGWFIRSANADLEEETDAMERVAELSDDESTDDAGDGQLPVAQLPVAVADRGTSTPDAADVDAAESGDVRHGDVDRGDLGHGDLDHGGVEPASASSTSGDLPTDAAVLVEAAADPGSEAVPAGATVQDGNAEPPAADSTDDTPDGYTIEQRNPGLDGAATAAIDAPDGVRSERYNAASVADEVPNWAGSDVDAAAPAVERTADADARQTDDQLGALVAAPDDTAGPGDATDPDAAGSGATDPGAAGPGATDPDASAPLGRRRTRRPGAAGPGRH